MRAVSYVKLPFLHLQNPPGGMETEPTLKLASEIYNKKARTHFSYNMVLFGPLLENGTITMLESEPLSIKKMSSLKLFKAAVLEPASRMVNDENISLHGRQ